MTESEQALAVHDTTAIAPMPPVPALRGGSHAVREEWLEGKRVELRQGEQVVGRLKELGLTPANSRKLQRAIERVAFMRKVVNAMERGYIPLPRFGSHVLDLEVEELPASAIVALAEAQRSDLWDEVRFVMGQQSVARTGPSRRQAARDPLLIGVIRIPEHRVPHPHYPTSRAWDAVFPGREEHFLIAWWRPEDERDETMF